ncbi:MAG TPA: FecR domain-containing protein [Candidatus Rifleibacterium sp.]|nr:FecR domain-containing protein [Candidatus Rifleibacterium sp.]HPT48184.1 FecR domain-containing protein [Candidatus Rifleibacterium sp.]
MLAKNLVLSAFLGAVFFSAGCGSQATPAAKIVSVSGQVEAKITAEQGFATAAGDMQLMAGGAVRTAKDSSASLMTLADSAKVDVAADSYFEVRAGSDKIGFQGEGKAVYDVNKQQKSIVVETRHGNTAVLGTRFGQIVSSSSFELYVANGKVEFTNKTGEKRQVGAGQQLIWNTSEALPTVVETNVVESEAIFGSGDRSFEFNRH